jgi:RHS repeat-associated protein
VAAGSYAITAKATDNLGGEATSTVVNVTVAGNSANAYYVYADHLNTPREVTDQSGNAVWRWDNSDPFGANVPDQNPGGTGTAFEFNLRFAGQYFDRESNLHYNYFRDYDPQTGRYIQSDPIGLEGGINTYGYVGGNPVSYVDPTGQAAFLPGVVGGIIGGMSAGISYYNANPHLDGGFFGAVSAGAAFGAFSAYSPVGWGVLGGMIVGGVAGAGGDMAGQYISGKAKANACGKDYDFLKEWNGKATAWQGGIGAAWGGVGVGAASAAHWAFSPLFGAATSSMSGAVGTGVSGFGQTYTNLVLPGSVGGYRP